jgi:hypothetical protein
VATFALIHGGGRTAWDWHLVGPVLRECGHDPVAVDLPCDDESAGWSEYRDTVVRAVGKRGDLAVVGQTLNFSEWKRPQEAETGEIEEVIRGGSMPPWYYTLQHSDAKLSGAEKDAAIQGLDVTIAASSPGG